MRTLLPNSLASFKSILQLTPNAEKHPAIAHADERYLWSAVSDVPRTLQCVEAIVQRVVAYAVRPKRLAIVIRCDRPWIPSRALE